MSKPLEIENLTKIYKTGRKTAKLAVDSLSLEVPEGIIYGFLGPNGAGKTTTIKSVLDFVRPTQGKATVYGKPATDASTRRMIGYLPEQPYFHKFLKPIEVLCMHAALSGVDRRVIRQRSLDALERVGIGEYADTPISKLSKGLTQRVGIAQAIVAAPKLLILDEPTSGLDPIGRRHTRDLLLELKNEGTTVFLSSHLLGEVENLCDVVAILKHGKLAANGTPDEVRSGNAFVRVQTTALDAQAIERLRFVGVEIDTQGECSLLRIDPSCVYPAMRTLEEMSITILRMDTERESLEEAFLRLAA